MPIKVLMDTSGDTSPVDAGPVCDRPRRRWLRLRRTRDERGATLVEYALLVAAFAIPTMTAISLLQQASQATIEDTASRVSSRSAPGDGG